MLHLHEAACQSADSEHERDVKTFIYSFQLMRKFMNGEMPAAPPLNMAIVDVRDVALAHFEAMRRPESDNERILVTMRNVCEMNDCDPFRLRTALPYGSLTLPTFSEKSLKGRVTGFLDSPPLTSSWDCMQSSTRKPEQASQDFAMKSSSTTQRSLWYKQPLFNLFSCF